MTTLDDIAAQLTAIQRVLGEDTLNHPKHARSLMDLTLDNWTTSPGLRVRLVNGEDVRFDYFKNIPRVGESILLKGEAFGRPVAYVTWHHDCSMADVTIGLASHYYRTSTGHTLLPKRYPKQPPWVEPMDIVDEFDP